jgi:hypothetical protein
MSKFVKPISACKKILSPIVFNLLSQLRCVGVDLQWTWLKGLSLPLHALIEEVSSIRGQWVPP